MLFPKSVLNNAKDTLRVQMLPDVTAKCVTLVCNSEPHDDSRAKVALRQSSDSHPDDTDWPKMAVRDGANSTDSSLRCLIGYLFGPATLCALRWANCFSTRVTNDEQLENRVIISRECSYA